MASPTGFRFPTVTSQISGSWTSPDNIKAKDSTNASIAIAAKNTTYELEGQSFGFSTAIVPANATITLVELEVNWYESSASNATLGIRALVSGSPLTDHTGTRTGSLLDQTFDITAERSWTPADLRDGVLTARCRAEQGNTSSSRTYYFDCCSIQVTFDMPATAQLAALFAGAGGIAVDASVTESPLKQGAALLPGGGGLASAAEHKPAASAAITGQGGLGTRAILVALAAAKIDGGSALTVNGIRVQYDGAILTGGSSLQSAATHSPFAESLLAASGTVSAASTILYPYTLHQRHFRFRTDALAVDADPAWGSELDGAFSSTNDPFRLRFAVANESDANTISIPWQLRASKNGGEYVPVSLTSTIGVKSCDAGASADGAQINLRRLE